MKKYGKYVVVRPKLSEFESNLSNEDALTWRDNIKYSGPQTEDFVFVAAVDTNYPIQTAFMRKTNYLKNMRQAEWRSRRWE